MQDDRHHGPGVPAVLEPLRRGLPREDRRGVAVGIFVEFVLLQLHGDRGTLQVKHYTCWNGGGSCWCSKKYRIGIFGGKLEKTIRPC